jgi:hypothetical protein
MTRFKETLDNTQLMINWSALPCLHVEQ